MKAFQVLTILAGAISTVAAVAAPINGNAFDKIEANGNTYTAEASTSMQKRGVGAEFFLQKRCDGPENQPTGTSCTPGACQCHGNAGCYSCNGKPPKCQATTSGGQPVTCY